MIIPILCLSLFVILGVCSFLPIVSMLLVMSLFFFSSRRRHTRCLSDWSSDVCSSDLTVDLLQRVPEIEVSVKDPLGCLGQELDQKIQVAPLRVECAVRGRAEDLQGLHPVFAA